MYQSLQGLKIKNLVFTLVFNKPFYLCFLFTLATTAAVTAQKIGMDTSRKTTEPTPEVVAVNATQKPHLYRMNYWASLTFGAVATAGDLYAIPHILHAKKQITDAEIAALNPNVFNGIDRWALHQDPSKRNAYYRASDISLPVVLFSVAALGFDKGIRKDWKRLLVMYYELQSINFSLYNYSFFGPAFQNKLRPVVYYSEFPNSERNGGNQRNSMFSGHTAQAAATSFFMAKVYSDYHPELGSKKYIYFGLAALPPLIVGYFRMKALAHFPSDILIGFGLGAVSGITVPALHRYKDRKVHFSVAMTSSGPGVGMRWQPLAKLKKPVPAFHQISSLP